LVKTIGATWVKDGSPCGAATVTAWVLAPAVYWML
jgi:hypothetical protein